MLEPLVVEKLVSVDHRIVVTGAGGWLGLATIDCLWHALGDNFSDRVVCVGSQQRMLRLENGHEIAQIALEDLGALPSRPTWVLHYAFLTKDKAQVLSEAEYRDANERIANTVCAALDRIGALGIFVASSGAAYRADDASASHEMRLYGALKLADEKRFAQWAISSKRRAVIARIFNVTGPYINKHEAYALASFILDALAGRNIEVKAPRRVVRAYVSISEILSLAFSELLSETQGVTSFDTGGIPLELKDVAQIVADQFSGVAVNRTKISDTHDDIYHGDSVAYRNLLSQHQIVPVTLRAQICKTIDYLRAGP